MRSSLLRAELLLRDGAAAMAELGIDGTGQSADLIVVENTDSVHNLVVCTLCSCYASALLGWPPDWFKSRCAAAILRRAPGFHSHMLWQCRSYRARAVREPRAVLAEFGLSLAEEVSVAVHDSTADMRYLVLPERPAGTEVSVTCHPNRKYRLKQVSVFATLASKQVISHVLVPCTQIN